MSDTVVAALQWGVLPVLGLASALAGWRVLVGPTVSDRVVGLELLTTIAIAIAACAAVVADQPALLDVSLVLALVVFLGAIAYARVIAAGGEESS